MSASREYAIRLALVGILLAIGVPALQRGETTLGVAFVTAGVVVAAWTAWQRWHAR